MARSKDSDQHRLDHAPRDYLEDPRGSGAGAYTDQGDQKQRGPGNYGGGRGTDYEPTASGAELSEEQARKPTSQGGAGDAALADQMGAGGRERPADGSRGDPDFGREGRSVNNPSSQGPMEDRD